MPAEDAMRSELVFAAMRHVSNRYLLVNIAAKATRKLHRPSSRIQETMDDALVRFSHANPVARVQEAGKAHLLHRTETESVEPHPSYTRQSRAVA